MDAILIELLSRLGVAILVRLVGDPKVTVLNALGLTINARNLAQTIVVEHGSNLFKDKLVRLALLHTIDRSKIELAFSTKIERDGDLESLVDFNWGKNSKSRLFLTIMGLDDAEFFENSDPAPASTIGGPIAVEQPLHAYQDWVRRQIVSDLLGSDTGRAIVHMPTGAGKTRVAMEALADFFRALAEPTGCAVWMAHSEELCEQACEAFQNVWARMGPAEANIVRLWGGQSGEIIDGKNNLVVTSFQTAYGMLGAATDQKFSLFTQIRRLNKLLIVDEAHQSIAPTYRSAIELISNPNTRILGLTATPGRVGINQESEGNEDLAQFYNNNKITIVGDDGATLNNPIKYLQEIEVLSNYEVNSIEGSELTLTDREARDVSDLLDIPQSVLKKLGSDHTRTARIAAAVLEIAVNRNMQTIVFAPTKDSAVDLALYLKLNDCAAAAITGETPNLDRANYISEYKTEQIKVLTNFGVLTAGFDAPNTQAIIIARPTLSVVLFSQMIGRGLRGLKMGGTKNCLIVDVKDNIINMPYVDEAFTYFDEFYRR